MISRNELIEVMVWAICNVDKLDPDSTIKLGMGTSWDSKVPGFKEYAAHADALDALLAAFAKYKKEEENRIYKETGYRPAKSFCDFIPNWIKNYRMGQDLY